MEIYESESAENASSMIEKAFLINEIKKDQVILHSDNGGLMKWATMLATLQRSGIVPSFSQSSVSKHNGQEEIILQNRHEVYEKARKKNPSWWSKKIRNWSQVKMVELNPGKNLKVEEKLAA